MSSPAPFLIGFKVGQAFLENPDSKDGRAKCPYPKNSFEEDQWHAGFDQALDYEIDARFGRSDIPM